MINIHLTISGRVQGVGFRWGALRCAQQLGLSGFVRNQTDGTVYIEAQGPRQSVTAFIRQLSAGPTPYAVVDQINQTAGKLQDYQGRFTVRR